jgi:hypothetical protein
MAPPNVAALLAAGAGSRFESTDHKLVAPLRGRPVWEWALAAVMDAGFDHVIVVTGALTLRIPSPAVEHHNPRWRDGQATSVQVALAAAEQLGASSVTIGLADQPFIPLPPGGRSPMHRRTSASSSPPTTGCPARTLCACCRRCGRCCPPPAISVLATSSERIRSGSPPWRA